MSSSRSSTKRDPPSAPATSKRQSKTSPSSSKSKVKAKDDGEAVAGPDSAFSRLEHEDACFMHKPESGLSMFLESRTKTIHFIRHAEGIHNEANALAGNNLPTVFSTPKSERYVDARLTDKGKAQCFAVREQLAKELSGEGGGISHTNSFDSNSGKHTEHMKQIQLVVVSPLTRTLETAQYIFGEADCGSAPPFIAHDLCRERSGLYTCDRRSRISQVRKRFAKCIDFDSFCPVDEDKLWTEERESDEDCTARAMEFVRWLSSRPEKEIAVVTHSSWLRHLFAQFGHQVVKEDKAELQRLAGNAELRSIVLCNHHNPDVV